MTSFTKPEGVLPPFKIIICLTFYNKFGHLSLLCTHMHGGTANHEPDEPEPSEQGLFAQERGKHDCWIRISLNCNVYRVCVSCEFVV
jgi:hypothetical protein